MGSEKLAKMQKGGQRARYSCDACAFRRVKCNGDQPCHECARRAIDCTRLRQRRKRGPKGPRPSTVEKIECYKERLSQSTSSPSDTSPTSVGSAYEEALGPVPAPLSFENVPRTYHDHLEIFRRQLYTVWPIVDPQRLATRLATHAQDWQSHALAASLCGAVIAQLRLDQRPEPGVNSQASEFVKEAQQLRKQHDYRESCTLDSLLTSFFLHIYYSNVQKLSTASYLLRETVTTAHILRLHEPETYETLPQHEYQRRLRIFWILFVTERTFCAQNDLAPILHPISEFPTFDVHDTTNASSMSGFSDLARLFIYLEASFFRSEPPSRITTGSQDDKVKILGIQNQLEQNVSFQGISETQHVDLNVTRHWIRTIIWQYTITHFAFSAQSKVPAFSATYPATIANDSLALLSRASRTSICAHGYGMELKILRLANSVLDILVCLPALKYSMSAAGWRDALHSLEGVLQTVGGGKSHFVTLLQRRMLEADLPISVPRELCPTSPVSATYAKPSIMERFLDASEAYEDEALCEVEKSQAFHPLMCG